MVQKSRGWSDGYSAHRLGETAKTGRSQYDLAIHGSLATPPEFVSGIEQGRGAHSLLISASNASDTWGAQLYPIKSMSVVDNHLNHAIRAR